MKVIVFNNHKDGGVSICWPIPEIFSYMAHGGLWSGKPRGYLEIQIERQISIGIRPDDARRFAYAVQFGGCTTVEALEIIRDRDCAPHGTAIELWDADEVPVDRWFRAAGRRSHNGGPININLNIARHVQFKRARDFVEHENRLRLDELDAKEAIEVDWNNFRQRIRSARDEHELRLIWPA